MSRGECKFQSNINYCHICNKQAHGVHHLLFGDMRDNADEDGIYIPICDECHTFGHMDDRYGIGHSKESRIHDNPRAEDLSKMVGEAMWVAYDIAQGDREKVNDSINRFRKRYGRNFL